MADVVSVSQGVLDNLKLNVNIPEIGKDLGSLGKMALPPQMSAKLDASSVDQMAEHVLNRTWDMSFRAAVAVLLVTGGWLLSSWAASRVQNALIKVHVEETLAAFLGSLLRFIIFFSSFVMGMVVVGVNTTSLAAILGATGLAVGLALKGTLGHVASGVMLMVHRPFKVGDWVETTNSIQGAVKRIGLFSTEINSIDNKRLFIPNTILWENVILNHTYQRTRMQEFTFRLSYAENTEEALTLVRRTLATCPQVLKVPEPLVGVTQLGLLGVECTLRVWHKKDDYAQVQFNLMGKVKAALDEAGFSIPTQPQTTRTDIQNARAEAAEKAAEALAEKAANRKADKSKVKKGKADA